MMIGNKVRFCGAALALSISSAAFADQKDILETKYIECLARQVRGVDDGVQSAAVIAKKLPTASCSMELQMVVSAMTQGWNDTEKMKSEVALAKSTEAQDAVKAVELFRLRLSPEDAASQNQVRTDNARAATVASDAEERRRVEALVQQELVRVAAEKYMQCASESVRSLDDKVSGADVVARGLQAGCASILQPLGTGWASALEKSLENNLVNLVLQYRARAASPAPPSNKAATPSANRPKVQS